MFGHVCIAIYRLDGLSQSNLPAAQTAPPPPAPCSSQVVVLHDLHVFKVAACILELICIVLCLGCLGHDPTFRQCLFADGVHVAAMSSLGLTVEHLASDI